MFTGLRNLGSTCYINCIIQVMRHTPGFALSIHRLNKKIEFLAKISNEIENEINHNSDITFVKDLHELLVEMSEREKSESRRPIYTPKKFVNTVWSSLTFWADGSQQDAHEFLQYTIHFINECDLFLRELERKYKIKNIPVNLDQSIQSVPQYNAIMSDEAKSNNHRFKRLNKQSTSKQSKQQQQQQQTVTIINEDSSSSTSSTWSTHSAHSNTTMTTVSSISSSSSTRLPPKIRQIKQPVRSSPVFQNLQQITSTTTTTTTTVPPVVCSSDYLRTPTKGGASSSSLDAMLATSSSSSLSSSQKSSQRSLEQQYQQQSDVQTSQFSSIKFFLDNTNKSKVEEDDKNLVSRRLRDSLNNSHNLTGNKSIKSMSSQSSSSSSPRNSTALSSSSAKRMKRESIVVGTVELRDDVIIINDSSSDSSELNDDDSDDEEREDNLEDEARRMDFDEAPYEDSTPINCKRLEDRLKSECERKFGINLRCYVRLERIDVERMRAELLNKPKPVINKEQTARPGPGRRPGRNPIIVAPKTPPPPLPPPSTTKRLRSKSRTFPPNQQPLLEADRKPTVYPLYLDMDMITPTTMMPSSELSAVASSSCLPTYPTSTTRTTRSSSNLNRCPSARSISSSSMLDEHVTPSSSSMMIDPTTKSRSPGELLKQRKSLPNPALSENATTSTNATTAADSYPYTCEMDQLFRGALVTVTQCLVCETKRERPETFYDRSIPIDDTIRENVNSNQADEEDEEEKRKCWINKCLVNESFLNDTSKYACDVCACKQEARMHTQYVNMPPVLIFHLLSYGYKSSHDGGALNAQKLSNRSRLIDSFQFASDSDSRHSNQTEFKPPLTKSIKQEKQQPQQQKQPPNNNTIPEFRLFAVVMHSGQTLNSGHYTAFVNYKIVSSHKNKSPFFDALKQPKINQTITNVTSADSNELNNVKKAQSPENGFESEWVHFDDTKVESMSNVEFHRKIIDSSFNSPYILFYVRSI